MHAHVQQARTSRTSRAKRRVACADPGAAAIVVITAETVYGSIATAGYL
jgi:hypothetical protein